MDDIEDQILITQKKKNQWEALIEEWQYQQRQEEELLGEIAYYSKGTISERQANVQLDYFEEEKKAAFHCFAATEEEMEKKKKELRQQADDLNEKYYQAKQEEYKKECQK